MPDLVPLVRLGWLLAEVRGRHRRGDRLPDRDARRVDPLPLRHERSRADALDEATGSLAAAVRRLGLDHDHDVADQLRRELSRDWPASAAFFADWDDRIQDALAEVDDDRANAYLLGRGLAECSWGLAPPGETGPGPADLLGEPRRTELTRMLGRLPVGTVHAFTPAAVSGSLAAWGDAVGQPHPAADSEELRGLLYDQVRGWYQLVVLGQDPTTLIRPYGKLGGVRGLVRGARLFWPQIVVAVVALGLLTGFLALLDDPGHHLLTSLLATSGLGAFTLAGLGARGQSAAQRLAVRLRQDAYTDLVAVSLTTAPAPPGRKGRRALERAVRRRALTPPTPAP